MLDRTQAALIVVDIQDVLMPKNAEVVEEYLGKLVKLVHSAQALDVPVLVTEQNPKRLGGTNARVAEAFGDGPRIGKMAFGCFGEPAFCQALEEMGRRQLIVCGMETHVCVMQTVLTALEQGFEPFVVRDAVVSMHKPDFKAGLERMAQAGAALVTTQMAVFELLRAAGTPEFKKMLPLLK